MNWFNDLVLWQQIAVGIIAASIGIALIRIATALVIVVGVVIYAAIGAVFLTIKDYLKKV